MIVYKSIKQQIITNQELSTLLETFREMINTCIKIGLANNIFTLRKFSKLYYHKLDEYDINSTYKLTAISQACGRLAQMKRDIKKGKQVKSPFIQKLYATNCYNFKVNGVLLTIPFRKGHRINILLNEHTVDMISELKPRSFTITPTSLSITVRKEINEIIPESAIGIDRNLRNVTISMPEKCIMYKTNKLLSIKENTMHVIASFRRNDRRVKNKFYQQHKGRRTRRIVQHLHKISKDIVKNAIESKSMIVLEDLKGIRKLYRKGNGQGNKFRRKLNSWSFYELQRQIEYKSKWEGIPVRFVNPRRTSMLCPICEGILLEDTQNRRKLLCINCSKSMDRDVVASMNIAYKGWSRFCHPRGDTGEAMVVESGYENKPVIQKVDVSKSTKKLDRTNVQFR